MGRRYGHLLINGLFAFVIMTIIIHTSGLLFLNLQKVDLNYRNDISYCLYSLVQDISTAKFIDVYDHEILLHDSEKTFVISLNQHRLVKTPGFNIYLNEVDDVTFSHDDQFVFMTLKRGDEIETFKIGIFYRPTYRICESDCVNDDSNTTFDDDINDTIDFSIQ